jgi:hypothetical protein
MPLAEAEGPGTDDYQGNPTKSGLAGSARPPYRNVHHHGDLHQTCHRGRSDSDPR